MIPLTTPSRSPTPPSVSWMVMTLPTIETTGTNQTKPVADEHLKYLASAGRSEGKVMVRVTVEPAGIPVIVKEKKP